MWPGRAGLNWEVGTGMGMVEGHPLGRSSGSSRRAAHTQLVTAHQPSWAELGSSNYRALNSWGSSPLVWTQHTLVGLISLAWCMCTDLHLGMFKKCMWCIVHDSFNSDHHYALLMPFCIDTSWYDGMQKTLIILMLLIILAQTLQTGVSAFFPASIAAASTQLLSDFR